MRAFYYMDKEVYFQGEKQPDRKVKLSTIIDNDDGTASCYDESGDYYILNVNDIICED